MVRRLALAELSSVAALWRAEQLEAYEDESVPRPGETLSFFHDVIAGSCKSWWVLEPDGHSIGAMLGLKHEHIAHLFVLPQFRGGGFGKKLVACAAKVYPRRLTVCTSRQAAAFYFRLGFTLAEPAKIDTGVSANPGADLTLVRDSRTLSVPGNRRVMV
jgi:GNAT superfamily N-acetyltransferase